MDFKDYYAALGVAPDVDQKTIKKAYQKLAKQYHPDVNPGDKAAEAKFKEATEAYEALGDPEKRRKYDELRQDYQQWKSRGGRGEYNWGPWQAGSGGTRTYNMSPEEFAEIFGGLGGSSGFGGSGGFGEGGYSDFFSTLFGMGTGQKGGGFGYESAGTRGWAGQDREADVQMTLEESYRGTTRLIRSGEKQIEAKIPKGVRTGSKVRLAGQGNPGISGGPNGDIYLNISVTPHSRFVREGDDLKADLAVDFYQAVLGGETRVSTFGGEIILKIPPRSQSGKKFRLKGKGMPSLEKAHQQGDLILNLAIVLPEKMSDHEIKVLSDLVAQKV